ncbi:hypothetical protein P9X10_01020 [Bacillus cereus]|nr:hypothetical protein [Bacillus cereus]
MILLDRLEFTREEQNCVHNKFEVRGFTDQNANMTMAVEEDTIVIAPNEDENAGKQFMYIGNEFGILKGTVVKLQLLFLDDAMFVNVVSGVIDTKTKMFSETGEDESWLLESYLDKNDEAVLEASEDENYPTKWLTKEYLFNLLNASIKNEYFTYETMFELDITFKKNGLFSCVPTNRIDISGGKVEEMKAEEKKQAELRKHQEEERKLARIREHEERKKEAEEKEHKKLALKNQEMKAMFDKLLNR